MADDRVCMVGGGVIGLALAWELSRRGRPVLVLERDEPGAGASDVAAGMLAPISEAEIERPEQVAFGLDSLERFPAFVRELEGESGVSCGYRTDGTLWVAIDRDDREFLEHLAETLAQRELPHRALTREQVLEREPRLSGRTVAGLLVERDHQLDPRALVRALAIALERRGGELRSGVRVESVERTGSGTLTVRGTVSGEPLDETFRTVVACAGPWTGRQVRLPLAPLGLRPLKGQVLRLSGEPLLRHVIRTPRVYLVPRDGDLLVGATMEEMGFDRTTTAGAAHDLLRHAFDLLPGIYELAWSEFACGLRSVVDDQLPLIGETVVEGLFLATAHYRHGILLAPATAHYLAERITGGGTPEAIAAFSPRRLDASAETRSR